MRHPMAADGSDKIPSAPPPTAARAPSRTRGPLWFVARCTISLAGICYALHFIHWSDRAQVPTAALGGNGAGAEECIVVATSPWTFDVVDRAGTSHRLDRDSLARDGLRVEIVPGLRGVLRDVDGVRLLIAA